MPKIEARYLRRLSAVYERQSTLAQVEGNENSRLYQESQKEVAHRYGWAENRIIAIDEDLGVSGASAGRAGYQRLLRLIREGQVGAVFISDVTRGGRDPVAWVQLLELMAQKDVLLFVDGRLTDTHDSAQVFVKQIEAVVAGRDNTTRMETMHRARLAKVRHGGAVTYPPVGYEAVYEHLADKLIKTGRWIKDRDPAVQRAIVAVFSTFQQERSLPRTCRALNQEGILIPGRHGRRRTWQRPAFGRLYDILTHPAFSGAYVYGRRHQQHLDEAPSGFTGVVGQVVELEDHHEGYITKEQFEENQRTLKLNANTPTHSHLGPGSALLQGLVRHVPHRHRLMIVAYANRRAQLRCRGDFERGGRMCITVVASLLERRILEELFLHLTGPSVGEVRRLWDARRHEWQRTVGQERQELRIARERRETVKRLLLQCNLEHYETRAMLEEEHEKRVRELREVEREEVKRAPDRIDPFTDERWDEVEQLCRSVREIWAASTTDVHDKKQLLRTVISEVDVEVCDAERIAGRIVWADGAADSEFEILKPRGCHRIMLRLHQGGVGVEEIVRQLNQTGALTQQGRPWSVATVQRTLLLLTRGSRGRRVEDPSALSA